MRLSMVVLLCSLAGVILGAALIGVAAVGGAVIFDSLAAGAWALMRDDGQSVAGARPLHTVPSTLEGVLERARRAG